PGAKLRLAGYVKDGEVDARLVNCADVIMQAAFPPQPPVLVGTSLKLTDGTDSQLVKLAFGAYCRRYSFAVTPVPVFCTENLRRMFLFGCNVVSGVSSAAAHVAPLFCCSEPNV